MTKSGLADSPFFHMPTTGESGTVSPPSKPPDVPSQQAQPEAKATTPSIKPDSKLLTDQGEAKPGKKSTKQPRYRGTTIPRHHDTTIPSMVSRYRDTTIEVVRSAVKQFGKEAATHRFTPEEKKAIADIIYAYKAQDIRTSENEIARIAVNFVVEDYRENGENSLLHQVIQALNE